MLASLRAPRGPQSPLARAGGPTAWGRDWAPERNCTERIYRAFGFLSIQYSRGATIHAALNNHAAPIVLSVEGLRDVRHITELQGKEAVS